MNWNETHWNINKEAEKEKYNKVFIQITDKEKKVKFQKQLLIIIYV